MEIFLGAAIMFVGLVVGWGLGSATSRKEQPVARMIDISNIPKQGPGPVNLTVYGSGMAKPDEKKGTNE